MDGIVKFLTDYSFWFICFGGLFIFIVPMVITRQETIEDEGERPLPWIYSKPKKKKRR